MSPLLREEGGINTYAYVGGNPISLVDPLGLYDVVAAVWGSNYLSGSVAGAVSQAIEAGGPGALAGLSGAAVSAAVAAGASHLTARKKMHA